jgi:HK97 family phage prohead protease
VKKVKKTEAKAMAKAKSDVERRNFVIDGCKIETRADGDDSSKTIIGHAAVFNELSENLGGFREIIKPGAFREAIEQDDVRALFNHNPDFILGRNKSGTLKLSEDERGLAIEITPPDTQVGRDLVVSMERGDITQMSFGFRVKAGGQSWGEDENGEIVRTLSDLKLFDVSPVTYPAYPQTDVALRSLDDFKSEKSKEQQRLEHKRLGKKLRLIEVG